MRPFRYLLCMILILAISGCGSTAGTDGGSFSASVPGTDILGNTEPWVDSDLYGSVTADKEIRLEDDFAAAVNGPWKLERGDKFYGTFQEASDKVIEGKKRILADESIQGANADVVRAYYALASDWDSRNKDGATPLKPYIDDIVSIGDTEEMYGFFFDRKRNPLGLGPVVSDPGDMKRSTLHNERYLLFLDSPDMSLSGGGGDNDLYFHIDTVDNLEKYEMVVNSAQYVLVRLGYTEKEASKLISSCMNWERQVAMADNRNGIEKIEDITYEHDKAVSLAKGFPLEELLNAWGIDRSADIVINPVYAKKLKSLCRKENLEDIKAFLIVNYCLGCSDLLDRDTYDRVMEFQRSRRKEKTDYGKTEEQLEDELMFDTYIGGSSVVGAMNQLFVENIFDESCIGELNTMTEDTIAHFRELFKNEEWMSEEGRAQCIEKLNSIRVHIAYQDFDSVDYKTLDIKTRSEGGNFLEAFFEAKRFEAEHMAWLSGRPYDINYWDPITPELSTTITNAAYRPDTNGIYIFAGVCVEPLYSPGMSYEEKLAGIFTIVGHEITHGFDDGGVQYDKDGQEQNWLPDEDQAAFTDRNDNVAVYYSTKKPYQGSGLYSGSNVSKEATADMGGIKITLMMAKDKPDFDYDRYFRAYAKVWKTNVPLEYEKQMFSGDVHPLAFYRVNVGLQQFDEFQETYGIKETDGMYLAPDKRIKVW